MLWLPSPLLQFLQPFILLKQHPQEIKLLTSTLLSVAAHVTAPPMGICSSTPPRRGSMSPTLSYKFPHSLNKEGQSEHICPLSGMSQKSNSCWPLFQTHCPVCPKGSLDELQLIYTNSTSYRECRARMLHSPVLWLWHKCNLLLRTGSYY